MTERIPAFLRRIPGGEATEAVVVSGLTLSEVASAQNAWLTFLRGAIQDAFNLPEHKHWDWMRKARYARYRSEYRLYGIECDGQMQGLMLVSVSKRCRLPIQADEPLVYVDYLSTAPWNLRNLTATPRFAGVGRTLLFSAIMQSRTLGFEGRVGLHSLPQAEVFYTQTCGMTDTGDDAAEYGLRYFEMTTAQADEFTRKGQ